MSNIEQVVSILRDNFPNLDNDIMLYIESLLLENATCFEDINELHDSIRPHLEEEEKSEEEIFKISEDIFHILVDKDELGKRNQLVKLDAPVTMQNINKLSIKDDYSKMVYDITKNEINNEAALENERKAQLAKSRKIKKPKAEIPTVHINQQFNKNTNYDCIEQSALINIIIDNFDMSFGNKLLLKEATFSINIGRRMGLIGKNGLGKTTLLKALAKGDLKLPVNISIMMVEQEVVSDNTTAIDCVLRSDKYRTSLMQQAEDITTSGATDGGSKLNEIYEKLAQIEADKAPSRVCKILKGLGFSSEMQLMKTREFSGGWRMRLSLAQALFLQPDLLLLDEPTNMLDMKATVWLEEYLKKWRKSLIVISHDKKFLDAACTDILYLHNQKIEHFKCNFSQFVLAKENRYQSTLREYKKQQEERDHITTYINRFRAYASKAASVQSKIKMLDRMKIVELPVVEKPIVFQFPDTVKLSDPIIQMNEVKFSYDGKRTILDIELLHMVSKCRICIVGENGAGKTTLLNLIREKLEPNEGFIRRHQNLRIGFFSQHHVDQLTYDQSSLEFLKTKYPSTEPDQYYLARLGRFGVSAQLSLRPISSLSGGEKSRVAFTILAMHEPNLLILDEPTNHLDMETIGSLIEAINKYNGGVILVSHDERLIKAVCTELWLVERNTHVSIVDGGIAKYKEMILKEIAEEE